MSRGRSFEPPDYLTDQDIHRMNNVRRDIWTHGAKGGVIGAIAGLAGMNVHQAYEKRHQQQSNLSKAVLLPRQAKNHTFLAVMLGAVIGSYASVRLAGMRSVRDLYPVFEKAHPRHDEKLDKIVATELTGHKERALKRRETLNDNLAEDARTHPEKSYK